MSILSCSTFFFLLRYNVKILKGESVLTLEEKGEVWPFEHKKVCWCFHPRGIGELVALVSYTPTLEADVKAQSTTVLVKAICVETDLKVC